MAGSAAHARSGTRWRPRGPASVTAMSGAYTPSEVGRISDGDASALAGPKAGMTEPSYLSSMNFFTSGELRSLASFLTRGSFSLPFLTARKLP